MEAASKIIQFIRSQIWLPAALVFLAVQLVFIVFEMTSWMPNFREGTLFEKIAGSSLFTERFTPYSNPELNLLTAFLAVALLPTAIICAFKDVFSGKRTKL